MGYSDERRPFRGKPDTRPPVQVPYERRVHETPKAVLFAFRGAGEKWIAKSQIKSDDGSTVTLPAWLCEKVGLAGA
jgi:hypothetical protein